MPWTTCESKFLNMVIVLRVWWGTNVKSNKEKKKKKSISISIYSEKAFPDEQPSSKKLQYKPKATHGVEGKC